MFFIHLSSDGPSILFLGVGCLSIHSLRSQFSEDIFQCFLFVFLIYIGIIISFL